MTSNKLYPHSLDNQFIRLLRLESGPQERPIRCTLVTVPLTTLPPYSCLSYTWSDPLYYGISAPEDIPTKPDDGQPKHPILCNSHAIDVTTSLHTILLEFSKNSFAREPLLWIDGICINQSDTAERSIQVSLMEIIYSSCQNVIIWLGPHDFSSPYAIEVISTLSTIPPSKYANLQISDVGDEDVYEKLGINEIESWKWLEYAGFLQRTWFRRIWVVQEAFLPKEIVVICGGDVIEWDDMVKCARILGETGLGVTLMKLLVSSLQDSETETMHVNNTINNQSIFQSMRDMLINGKEEVGRQLGLEKLLYYSRFFDATDAKDKVYAVYGVWTKGGKIIPKDMMPNYKLEVEAIYTRAAWEMIQETGDLNILSQVEDSTLVDKESVRAKNKLPSWVPDFSSSYNPQPLAGNPRPSHDLGKWNASSDLRFEVPKLPPLEQQHLLPVLGYKIDTICEFAATQGEIMGDKFGFTSLLRLLANYSNQVYPDSNTESYFEAIWRTCIKDTFRKLPATQEARRFFQYFVAIRVADLRNSYNDSLERKDSDLGYLQALYDETKSLIDSLSKHNFNKGLIPNWETLEHLIEISEEEPEVPEKVELDKDYFDISEAFRVAYSGRRLFRTSNGYLGIAAQGLEIGDEVWIIAGAKVPIVIRKGGLKDVEHDNWRLVGEAYVHGVMKGGIANQKGVDVKSIYLF